MTYNFKNFKDRTEEIKSWLKNEYLGIQTGRATPAILDNVKVESYGSKVSLQQVASIMSEGPRSLRVTSWDASQIKAIEKAIEEANLGISVSSDDKGVRINFPELTSEKRETLLKLVKNKHEEARVSLRVARDDVWQEIQKQEKEGDMGEDEKFRLKDEMEKITAETNKELDDVTARKEKDISGE